MAFRIEAPTRGLIAAALLACSVTAQPFTVEARHRHLHGGAPVSLTFTATAISVDEKSGKHSGSWNYDNIQTFELSPTEIRIRTYDDIRWQLGRDREYVFDHIAKADTAKLYPFLSARLDQRFNAQIPEPVEDAQWQVPAKLLQRYGGYNGTLKIGTDRIVFDAPGEHASRTWRYSDIENLSSEGPLQLSFTSLQGETRFALKQALPEDRYNQLWRRVMEANGLKVFSSQLESHHE